MKEVGTAILKNKLSAYLGKVRKGERFLVTDRGVPVAKLVPLSAREEGDTLEEKLAAMAAAGKIRLPITPGQFSRSKPIKIPGLENPASSLISEMREEREQAILPRLKRPG
ncbi:MAG: type II toxin-antitoxin system prevent-host-death family antitoxin [Deltaproteobacteria bacterium]|nr:type II toxin-antitoxin system prevent-host-death family antitoxin [Deltaproteobacteria bacterium]